MLIKQKHLQGIKSGEISLAFRKWKKPRVKSGSLVNTSVGQIEIVNISEISQSAITADDAAKAGFEDLKDVMKILTARPEGNIYKIEVRFHAADPRIELRNKTDLSRQEIEQLKTKLIRLDKYSKQGHWTIDILKAIRDNPKLKAGDLAVKTGNEKAWLKLNIRKLKNLGLTISHEQGYSLSPRGAVLLESLANNNT